MILGKSHKQTAAQRHSHAPPGHHSVTGSPTDGGLVYTEYVIYRGEQVSMCACMFVCLGHHVVRGVAAGDTVGYASLSELTVE